MTMPTRRPAQSTRLRSPMPEETSEGKDIYLGFLERYNILLTRENLRLRACLELATGQPWDSVDTADMSNEDIDEYVARDIARGLNLSIKDARSLVAENKVTANPSQVEGKKANV